MDNFIHLSFSRLIFLRLTAANCFNGSDDLRIRVIDQKSGTVSTGKADGLKSISLEVLDTFGIGDAIRNESHRVEEVVLWEPDGQGGLERSITIADRIPELGKPREMTLDQGQGHHSRIRKIWLTSASGRIEHHLTTNLEKHGNVEISWRTRPVDLQINRRLIEDHIAYPITVTTEVSGHGASQTQVIQAKYVIACDGARSWTRKHLDIPLRGDHTDSTWGRSCLSVLPRRSLTQTFRCHGRGTKNKLPRHPQGLCRSLGTGYRHGRPSRKEAGSILYFNGCT